MATATLIPVAATPEPTPETPTPAAIPDPTPAAVDLASSIVDFKLENLTVPVGTTVTWRNLDEFPHTSTAGTPGDPTGVWESPTLSPGASFAFTFAEEGTFLYFCKIHPSIMTATVTVGQS